MGLLVNGAWHNDWYDTHSSGGHFVRKESGFRDAVSREPGARFPALPGRYHLYVSYACPWAHRTLIVRAMKGLEAVIPISITDAFMGDEGWSFSDAHGASKDPYGAAYLHEVYTRTRPDYTGRVTVPVLWDNVEKTIVNNESSEILRMLNDAFEPYATRPRADLYPLALRAEIDAINQRVYHAINDGVYRAGFATKQAAYEQSVTALFDALDALELHLEDRPYLVGGVLTEADIRLFTTLLRFDAVYHGHFKCNFRRLVDYPRLRALAGRIYDLPHVAETVRFDHIKEHYYRSHKTINPTGIIPLGPVESWGGPESKGKVTPSSQRA